MSIAIRSRMYEMKDKDGKVTTRVVRLPRNIKVGKTVSMVGGRLLLIDTRGEINENELLDFFERIVEPPFWEWIAKKQKRIEEK